MSTEGAIKGDIAITSLTYMGIEEVREMSDERMGILSAAVNRMALLVDIVTNERRVRTVASCPPPDNVVPFRKGAQ